MNKRIILPLSSLLLLASCATAQEVTNNDYLTAKVLAEARRNADALTLVSGQSTSLDDRSVIYPRNVASFVDYSSAETRLEVHRYDGSLWVKAEEERETGTKANRYHGQQSLGLFCNQTFIYVIVYNAQRYSRNAENYSSRHCGDAAFNKHCEAHASAEH